MDLKFSATLLLLEWAGGFETVILVGKVVVPCWRNLIQGGRRLSTKEQRDWHLIWWSGRVCQHMCYVVPNVKRSSCLLKLVDLALAFNPMTVLKVQWFNAGMNNAGVGIVIEDWGLPGTLLQYINSNRGTSIRRIHDHCTVNTIRHNPFAAIAAAMVAAETRSLVVSCTKAQWLLHPYYDGVDFGC